jgi:hypothetical protein
MTGRVRVYDAIVRGESPPSSGVPESFRVLLKEMQSLGLKVNMYDEHDNLVDMKHSEDDAIKSTFGISLDTRPNLTLTKDDELAAAEKDNRLNAAELKQSALKSGKKKDIDQSINTLGGVNND